MHLLAAEVTVGPDMIQTRHERLIVLGRQGLDINDPRKRYTLKSLEGDSGQFRHFTATDVYTPNVREFISRPLQYAYDVLTFLPGTFNDLLRATPSLVRQLQKRLFVKAVRNPSWSAANQILEPVAEAFSKRRDFPSVLDYLPSGCFDNAGIERFLRRNFKAIGCRTTSKTYTV